MSKSPDGKYDWIIFTAIGIVLVFTWYYSGIVIDKIIVSSNPIILTNEMARGVFGDKFGAITSLFSALAFLGIIFTVLLQRRDLNQQRYTIAKQSFESSLFSLLEHHKNNIEQLELNGYYKRQTFKYFIELILQNSEQFPVFNVLNRINRDDIITIRDSNSIPELVAAKLENAEISTLQECISTRRETIGKYLDENFELHWKYIQFAYLTAHKRSGNALSHYFCNLYVIYKYIDDAPALTFDQKKEYGRIVRAQLSDDELLAIFYNSLTKPDNINYLIEFGYPKMTNLIFKYDILQNLNKNRVFHPIHWKLLDSCKPKDDNK